MLTYAQEPDWRQRRGIEIEKMILHYGSNNLEIDKRCLHYGCIPAPTTGMETEKKLEGKKLKVLVSSADMSHLNEYMYKVEHMYQNEYMYKNVTLEYMYQNVTKKTLREE